MAMPDCDLRIISFYVGVFFIYFSGIEFVYHGVHSNWISILCFLGFTPIKKIRKLIERIVLQHILYQHLQQFF